MWVSHLFLMPFILCARPVGDGKIWRAHNVFLSIKTWAINC